MNRVERIRLYPSPRQERALRFMLDVTRELYNALLQERRDAFRFRGVRVSTKQQYAEITALRSAKGRIDRRLSAVYRDCEDATLHRLDLAFESFFRRLKRGEDPGNLRFKSASRWRTLSFPHGNRAVRFDKEKSRVTVPGVGSVKFRKGRAIPAFGRAWIGVRNDRWYACFECTRYVTPLPANGTIIGVDRGVHVLAAISDGRLIRNLAVGERRRLAASRLQRQLEVVTNRDASGRVLNVHDPARKKAARRLALARERERNSRLDNAHKTARSIVRGAEVIGLEKLNLRAMTRSSKGTPKQPGRNVAAKAALNRRLLDAGFGLLRQMILAKVEETARRVVEVDARFSSQECSRCGHISRESRRRRRFACVTCDYKNHADINAALVIRGRAQLALMSEPQPAEDAGRLAGRVA